jgi:hypothetical protein
MNFFEFAPPIGDHKELNPKLWDHDRMKNDVRGALLRIAEDFIEFIGVPIDVEDIVVTGGNANYTYTNVSDIDLHIITDFSNVDCDREAYELMDTKRLLYKKLRDIEVHGIPVELYVEDINRPAVSNGCYSVARERWLKPPTIAGDYDEAAVKHYTEVWKKIIAHAIKTGDLNTARTTMRLLKSYRTQGLATPEAEFSTPNLVYKTLRNADQVRALQHMIDVAHDQSLSV